MIPTSHNKATDLISPHLSSLDLTSTEHALLTQILMCMHMQRCGVGTIPVEALATAPGALCLAGDYEGSFVQQADAS